MCIYLLYVENGCIDFAEFCTLMEKNSPGTAEEEDEELRNSFKIFDKDGSGYIDADELRVVLEQLGDHMTKEEINELIREADLNGDGVIDYEGIYIYYILCLFFKHRNKSY